MRLSFFKFSRGVSCITECSRIRPSMCAHAMSLWINCSTASRGMLCAALLFLHVLPVDF